jgi:hypothetical protein
MVAGCHGGDSVFEAVFFNGCAANEGYGQFCFGAGDLGSGSAALFGPAPRNKADGTDARCEHGEGCGDRDL